MDQGLPMGYARCPAAGAPTIAHESIEFIGSSPEVSSDQACRSDRRHRQYCEGWQDGQDGQGDQARHHALDLSPPRPVE